MKKIVILAPIGLTRNRKKPRTRKKSLPKGVNNSLFYKRFKVKHRKKRSFLHQTNKQTKMIMKPTPNLCVCVLYQFLFLFSFFIILFFWLEIWKFCCRIHQMSSPTCIFFASFTFVCFRTDILVNKTVEYWRQFVVYDVLSILFPVFSSSLCLLKNCWEGFFKGGNG